MRHRADPWPTRVVLVARDGSELLGLEVERAEGGRLVEVRLHDGRHLWVRASAVHPETLVPGELVALRWNGETALRVARIEERTGDIFVVELVGPRGGGRAVVSLADVMARLARSPTAEPPSDDATPPPPPVDLARQVSWRAGEAWAPATLVSCGATFRVTYADAASEDVRAADLAELRVAVGDRVAAFSGNYSYAARVETVQGPVARLRFDDGSEQWLELMRVRFVERPPRPIDPSARPRWLDAACRSVGQAGREPVSVLVRRWSVRSAGAIAECEGGRAVVMGRDGARSEIASSDVSLLGPEAGDTVRVRWRGSSLYLGTIERIEGTQIALRWEDGSSETVGLDVVAAHFGPARRVDTPRVPPACGGPPLSSAPTRIIQEFPTP